VGFESEPTVKLPAPSVPKNVMRYIEERAQWWTESGVRPGEWVFFDASMYKLEVDADSEAEGAVMFFDIVPPGVQIRQGRRRRLHGSSTHLVARPPIANVDEMLVPIDFSVAFDARRWNMMLDSIEGMSQVRRRVREVIDSTDDLSTVRSGLSWLINEIADNGYNARLAAWMVGCAQVTAIIDIPEERLGVVIASPLYIERVPAPGEDI
jgi:hypothetical protein